MVDKKELEIMNFAKYRPLHIPMFDSRSLGKYYYDVSRCNRQLMSVFAKNSWFPFCRGWEYSDCEKRYYVTYRVFKNSNMIKYYDIITCFPNHVTEYDDFYLISLYVSSYPISLPLEIN